MADEPFAEWAYDERDRLRHLAAGGLREMVRIDLATGDHAGAASSLDRLSELEPYDVDTYKTLLAVYVAQGRRSEAARRYQAFKMRLAREFGEEPGFELAEVRLEGAT